MDWFLEYSPFFESIWSIFGIYFEENRKKYTSLNKKKNKKFELNRIKLKFLAFEFIQKIDKLVLSI